MSIESGHRLTALEQENHELKACIAQLNDTVSRLELDGGREFRYQRFFEAIEAGFCIIEMKFDDAGNAVDYRFLEMNAAFEKHTGLSNARLRWVKEMVPQHEQHWFDLYGSVARTGNPIRFENVAEGLGRWFDVHALVDGERGQNRVAVLFSDITERRRAEHDLRELTQKLEQEVQARTTDRNQLWTLSRDVMLRCRLDGEIVAVNPAWESVLGWSERELLGADLYALVHPDDVERTRQAAADYASGDAPPIFENRYRTKNGDFRWIAWSVQIEQGVLNAVGRDITEEKVRDDMLHQTEARLRQSQKMEAVGQLTGGIAHDFNNLLTAITASLQLLGFRIGRGQFTGVERYVSAAEGAVRRAAALTNRLLAFARQQPLDPVPTALCDVAEDISELILRAVAPRCELNVACDVNLWNVLIDRNQMESALLNLCINARDAMPDGGVIQIRLDNAPAGNRAWQKLGLPEGDYVVAHVTDTGTGMSPEIAARAFDPFFTTKPQGQGTGLGLSMIYGFATQSGGLASIDSTPGKGSTVSIYLPRFQGQSAPPAPVENQRLVVAGSASSATILVVDDEDAIRMLLTEVLEEAGYRVLEASDASSALTVLESNARLDMLVTDIGLPGAMDGHRLASLARDKRENLHILMISGHAELIKEELATDTTHLLRKPFSMDELTAKVKGMLSQPT